MFEYGTTLAGSVNSETQHIALGLRQRNIAFLQELVGRYQYRLVRYLIYLLGRRDEVDDLVQDLQRIGANAHDVISILQAMKEAGALEAELEVL